MISFEVNTVFLQEKPKSSFTRITRFSLGITFYFNIIIPLKRQKIKSFL